MENIIKKDFIEEMSKSFLEYSMEVITDRAIPDVYDGCKPVHRRILFDMIENLKLHSNKPFVKSAKVVGSVVGNIHPHSDSSVYDAACNLTTEHSMRYPLIEGQGSFGDVTGSEAAAMRYTEMRPSKIAELMLEDYNKNAVNTKLNFSEDMYEPIVLPSLFPNILCNPTMGIAVGMAANFASHNLTEVCNGIVAYINNENITIEEMMEHIKGPDFPLGGVIINSKDILAAYKTGRSAVSLKVRGDYKIEGKDIIFTSLPYGVSTNKIIEQVTKHIDTFSNYFEDFRDDTNAKNGVKIIFTLSSKDLLEDGLVLIFKHTDLQSSFSINQNCLLNGSPKTLGLLEIIKAYVEHQSDVLVRTNIFDREKARARVHILNGLLLALNKIDTVISIIRNSSTKEEAREKLISSLSIDEIQANSILDMKLARLTKLNEMDIKTELKEKQAIIEECTKIIENKDYLNEVLKSKIIKMRDNYGDARRTKLEDIEIKKVEKEKVLISEEEVIVSMNKEGYVKRSPKNKVKDKTAIETINIKRNETLVAFDLSGMAYKVLVDKLEDKYKSFSNFNEEVKQIAHIDSTSKIDNKVAFITKLGNLKISTLEDYSSNRATMAIKLKEGDSILAIGNHTNYAKIITSDLETYYVDISKASVTGKMTMGSKIAKLQKELTIKSASFVDTLPNGVKAITKETVIKVKKK